MAQANDKVVAVLLSYEMKEDDDYVVEDPVLKPFWLLEEPGSLYIAGVAVDPALAAAGDCLSINENGRKQMSAKALTKNVAHCV